MDELLQTLVNLSALQALGFFLGLNLVTVLASAGFCWLLGQVFRHRRLFDRWEPFSRIELLAVLSTIGINALTSVAGWLLWKHGFITLTLRPPAGLIADLVIMVVAMDLGMYFLHRSAHWRPLYPTLHAFHHRHEATNPVSLFILHPFEVFGFAALMTGFLVFHDMDVRALLAYLTLNVLWGTIGHSGVEPFPRFVARIPLLNLVGTSTFHAGHHEHPGYNFGFYSLVWDKLFGTLDPDYRRRYEEAHPSG